MKTLYPFGNTQVIISLLVPLFACGLATAGEEVVSPAVTPDPQPVPSVGFGSYLGVSGVLADTTLRFPGLVAGDSSATTGGFRVDGSFVMGGGFAADGFFQYLEDDGDAESYDGGGVITYKHALAKGFSGVIGAGYEWRTLEITDGFDTENQAILACAGIEYQMDRFLARLTYTQGFTNSSEIEIDTPGFSGSADLEDEDSGTLDLRMAYQFYRHLSVTVGGSVELLQKASITDDWSASLGLRYDF
jgi:hypothetical protein